MTHSEKTLDAMSLRDLCKPLSAGATFRKRFSMGGDEITNNSDRAGQCAGITARISARIRKGHFKIRAAKGAK